MKHFEMPPFAHTLPSPVGPHPLENFLTERRIMRYRQVLARRTTRLTVVVDNCHDAHNASAVIRSCDAFGIHRVFVITDRNSFRVNRKISQGAHLYTDLQVFRDVESLYDRLRSLGYRILVADLAADAVVDPHILQAEIEQTPLALVFGNEEGGTSQEAIDRADGRFLIPMSGFTQSLNLSVSVAITLFSLRHAAIAQDRPGDMTAQEQGHWFDVWLRRRDPERRAKAAGGKRTIDHHGEIMDSYGGSDESADSHASE